MKFNSTATWGATADLGQAVNAAVTAEHPLPTKRGPGTGKSCLARKIAGDRNLPQIAGQLKSTTRAQLGICELAAGRRLRDSQPDDGRMQDTASSESVRIAALCRKLRKL